MMYGLETTGSAGCAAWSGLSFGPLESVITLPFEKIVSIDGEVGSPGYRGLRSENQAQAAVSDQPPSIWLTIRAA
jgi:hypothetical protein